MQFRISAIALLFTILLLSGCDKQTQREFNRQQIAFGDISSLTIIADQNLWESEVGDTIEYYYSAAYPILPQPEPLLDLKHFTVEELAERGERKELRTYLIVADLTNDRSPATQLIKQHLGDERVRRAMEDPGFNSVVTFDKWAKGQLLIYQFSRGKDRLIRNIKENFPASLQRIRKHDENRLDATVYLDGRNESLEQLVRDKYGLDMQIPGDYVKAISDSTVTWFRKETPNASNNLMFYTEPYERDGQLSRENIKEIRDSLGRKYVSTRIANTYMRINDEDLPMYVNTTKVDDQYALQATGIWEVANDYMGGPFVSYLILDAKDNQLIFIDGFVHAPGETKRNFMLYLEHIISTIKIR